MHQQGLQETELKLKPIKCRYCAKTGDNLKPSLTWTWLHLHKYYNKRCCMRSTWNMNAFVNLHAVQETLHLKR